MKIFEEQVKELIDLLAYLQLIGSFDPDTDFRQTKEIVVSTYDFLKTGQRHEIEEKLPHLKKPLEEMAALCMSKFPPKTDMKKIAHRWNELFKNGNEVYDYGVTFGWLNELMELRYLKLYDHIPYHFRIGLGPHKGHGGIEEEFLLKDAFNVLVRAEYFFDTLIKYADNQILIEENSGQKEFNKATYKQVTDLKYEVSAFSRLTIISFYAFIESFINSVGFSHMQRHKNDLSEDDIEILNGQKKGRYLQLKSKIERFQKIIRADNKALIITTDDSQIQEPFKSFFAKYEELRNASVHYSPLKEAIWFKPADWLEKAKVFSKLSVDVGLNFWKSCYENSDGPQYMGKLDYEIHLNLTKKRLSNLETIQFDFRTKA